MTKGILWKYDADFDDPFLRDRGNCPDPDFASNNFPVWAICAPYKRKSLRKRDVVFFIPQKQTKNFDGYLCGGILVVKESIATFEEALRDARLTFDYRERYRIDMNDHLCDDEKRGKIRTKQTRPKNLVLGDPKSSLWFGKGGAKIEPLLLSLGLRDVLRALKIGRNQSIRHLIEKESAALYLAICDRSESVDLTKMRLSQYSPQTAGGCIHIRYFGSGDKNSSIFGRGWI